MPKLKTTFSYSVKIRDAAGQQFEMVEAWVDTGASYTLLPRGVLQRLGYSPTHHRPFQLADGTVVEMDLCQVPLRIGQETSIVSCVFGEEGSEPLLGATALEEFGLGVDPINHTLVPIVLKLLGFHEKENED